MMWMEQLQQGESCTAPFLQGHLHPEMPRWFQAQSGVGGTGGVVFHGSCFPFVFQKGFGLEIVSGCEVLSAVIETHVPCFVCCS